MSHQSYKNHIRFYAPHHFVFYPISLILIIIGILMANKNPEHTYIWWFLTALTIVVTWLSFMMRQHYALTLQNRLIRLEVAHRYFVLSGKDFSEIESNLKDGQIFALRFAPNEEFLLLVDKALTNKLSSDEIKEDIKNWKADESRV